jgi:hypothetical protein
MNMNSIILSVIRGMACMVLIVSGGIIATQVNAIIGCLVTATGMLAILAPFIIEDDKKRREQRLQQTWERYDVR